MSKILDLYTLLPNFKGKNYLGNALTDLLNVKNFKLQKMHFDFQLNLDLNDRIQRQMYLKRVYEDKTVKSLLPFLKESSVFFDIGANIGYFSMLGSAVNPNLEVYAFEPMPNNIDQFNENLKLNPIAKVQLFEICLSDTNGPVEFTLPPNSECGWGRISYKKMFDDEKIERESMRVDSFCEKHNIDQVDLIKIDVEGFEYHVLQGATQLLASPNPPTICVEMNEPCFEDLGIDICEVFSFLKKFGYKMHYLDHNGKLTPTGYPVQERLGLNYFAIRP